MNPDDASPVLRAVVRPERWAGRTVHDGVVALDGAPPPSNRRFEGLYGRLYDHVVQRRTLRRAAFSVWGSADPLHELEAFVADAVSGALSEASSRPGAPLLVDLPSGGGTLLPLLDHLGFGGTVLEIDLAGAMLRRARAVHRTRTPDLDVALLQDDALDLSLRDSVADLMISVNGLHVMPDPRRFLAEVARTTRPGGAFWMITPVDGPSLRSRAILAAARGLAITPGRPPTLRGLRALLAEAGFTVVRSYGGESITGVACVRE